MSTGNQVDARLLRLLGGDALAALRRRLRQRFERGEGDARFRLNDINDAERRALAGLLGRPPRLAASITIDPAAIDAALRHAGLATSLHDALEQLDGPLINRVAERAEMHAQWNELSGYATDARLAALLADPNGMRLLKRLARSSPDTARHLLDAAQAVLRALPASGIPRSALAAETLGNAHGLDRNRPEASLVLAVLRQASRQRQSLAEVDDAASDESERSVWAGAGVLVNELARPVLFLNLPVGDGSGPAPGEPGYLSLRQLLRTPPRWKVAGRDVYVCENPNLVAIAADALGIRCAPLVCTDGMPAAAQRTLLVDLARAGARLRYHGDFDWAGLHIGNRVMRECGATPWRFGADDYRTAVAAAGSTPGRPLGTTPVDADWDPQLAPAMRAHDRAIDEEALAEGLMRDLEGKTAPKGTAGA